MISAEVIRKCQMKSGSKHLKVADLITFKLRCDKCPVFWEFLVDEFHLPAVFKFLDPLFVWHFRISSAEIMYVADFIFH